MKNITFAAILAAILTVAGGLAIADNNTNSADSSRSAGQLISDTTIKAKIAATHAMDGNLDASAITSSVKNGVVVLNGTVPSAEEKTIAAQLAKDVKGVKKVINRLAVAQPKPDSSITSDSTTENLKTKAVDSKTTAVIIGKLLKEYNLDTNNVHVNTTDKTVTLTGSVQSDADRTTVENIVKNTNDVASVVNNLTVAK